MPITGFDNSIIVKVTNNSGESKTNPVIPLHILPYSAIQKGAWTVDGNINRYRIPISIAEMSDGALTDYKVRVGPIDTAWLKDNGWATATGNEVRFTSSDGETLLDFWLQEGPGWDVHATYYHVQMSLTALQHTTIYMYCDSALGAVESASDDSIFDLFQGFDTDVWTLLAGDTSFDEASVTGDIMVAVKYTATESGTATYVQIRKAGAGNTKVGIYADNGSGTAPTGTALASNAGVATPAGINNIKLSSTTEITASTIYWLVFNTDTTGIRRTTATGVGTAKYEGLAYANPLPDLTAYGWDGDATSDYSIAAYEMDITGWTIVGTPPVIADSEITLTDSYITSDATFARGKAVRMYLEYNEVFDCRWGFKQISPARAAVFLHGDTPTKKSIACTDNVDTDLAAQQYPYPVSEYAIWDVRRRAATTNKAAWTRFDANGVLCTDAPLWDNQPTESLPVILQADGGEVKCKWLFVTDYVSPEPIVNIPQIYHHPDILFLNSLCEHWPYDVAIAKQGSSQQLYYHMDEPTLSSEYATQVFVKYDGVIANEEYVYLDIHFTNNEQTTWSAFADASNVFDFWDTFVDDSQWTEDSGDWAVAEQQRPEVFDHHLMNAYPETSYVMAATPIWTGDDSIERFIAIVGSWNGISSNNQSNPQWPIPWEIVLYEKHGDKWYRWGNVLTGEYNGFNHASAIPMWLWEGDDAELGDADWLYMIVGTTTVADGDFASYIFVNKDKTGRTWEALNDGAPFADYTCVDGADTADRGRFSQLIFEDSHYYVPFAGGPNGWDAQYLHGDSSDIEDMLYDLGTITPADVWTDGGVLIDLGGGDGIEEPYFHKKDDGSWICLYDTIITRNAEYSSCAAVAFDTAMADGDWTDHGDVTDIDDMYEWSRHHIHDPHIKFSGSNPVMVFGGQVADDMMATYATAFATNSIIAGTGWTPSNLSNRYLQTTDAESYQIARAAGEDLSEGRIVAICSLDGADAGSYAGIIWRYNSIDLNGGAEDNYYAWFVDDINDRLSYGKMEDGVFTNIAGFDLPEGPWRGEEYRLMVEFDGTTTTLKYSRLGWEWVNEDLELTDAVIPSSGGWGLLTFSGGAYFDNTCTYGLGIFGIEIAPFIQPASISSAEALGTATIVHGIQPTAITSVEAFGTLQINQTISVPSIVSSEAFGTPQLGPSILIPSIPSTEAFGTCHARVEVDPQDHVGSVGWFDEELAYDENTGTYAYDSVPVAAMFNNFMFNERMFGDNEVGWSAWLTVNRDLALTSSMIRVWYSREDGDISEPTWEIKRDGSWVEV